MQIVPRRFCHISTKMSVLWPSENAKIRFLAGALPRTPLGELTTPPGPRPSSRLKRGPPPHTLPHSTPIHFRPSPSVPPEFQPDLRLWVAAMLKSRLHSLVYDIVSVMTPWATYSVINLSPFRFSNYTRCVEMMKRVITATHLHRVPEIVCHNVRFISSRKVCRLWSNLVQ